MIHNLYSILYEVPLNIKPVADVIIVPVAD